MLRLLNFAMEAIKVVVDDFPAFKMQDKSTTISSQSSWNLGAGRGLVNISAMFAAVLTYSISYAQLTCCAITSPQNFKRMSKCIVLDFAESFPIEEIAGRLSPQFQTTVNFSILIKPMSINIS